MILFCCHAEFNITFFKNNSTTQGKINSLNFLRLCSENCMFSWIFVSRILLFPCKIQYYIWIKNSIYTMVKSILRTLLRLCSENCSLLNSVGMIKLIFAFHAKFNINSSETNGSTQVYWNPFPNWPFLCKWKKINIQVVGILSFIKYSYS